MEVSSVLAFKVKSGFIYLYVSEHKSAESMTDSLLAKLNPENTDSLTGGTSHFYLLLVLIVLSLIIVNFVLISIGLSIWR